MQVIVRALSAIVLASAVAACSSGNSASSPSPSGPLLVLYSHGGLCPDGMECRSTVAIERDGRVRVSAKPPNYLGTVAPDKLAALEAAINAADFAALNSHPFTGTCPTDYDLQEVTYQFSTPRGFESVASCSVEVDLDSPLFVAVSAAFESASSTPTP